MHPVPWCRGMYPRYVAEQFSELISTLISILSARFQFHPSWSSIGRALHMVFQPGLERLVLPVMGRFVHRKWLGMWPVYHLDVW